MNWPWYGVIKVELTTPIALQGKIMLPWKEADKAFPAATFPHGDVIQLCVVPTSARMSTQAPEPAEVQ
jgi:hypothetical protein